MEHGEDYSFLSESNSALKLYCRWVKETALYPTGIAYPVQTMCAEAGEVLNDVNKQVRRTHKMDVQWSEVASDLQMRIKHEASDVLWALAALCNEMGITIEELAGINRAKLEARARDGTIYAKS